jgi:TB2/DP1, HVA22 family
MEYVHAAKLVSTRARFYSAELFPLLRDLADAVLDVFLVSVRLVAVLSRPLLALLVLLRRVAQPLAAAALAAAWHSFSAQTPQALAAEAAGTSALACIVLLEQRFGWIRYLWRTYRRTADRIAASYLNMKRAIRDKSRFAAAALSHALFLTPTSLLLYFFGPAVDLFCQRWGLFLVSFAHPAYKTVAALYIMDMSQASDDVAPPNAVARSFLVLDGTKVNACGNPLSVSAKKQRTSSTPERRTLFADALPQSLQSSASDVQSDQANNDAANDDEESPKRASLRARRSSKQKYTSTAEAAAESPVPGRSVHSSNSRLERAIVPVVVQRSPTSFNAETAPLRSHEVDLLRFWSVYGVVWAARGVLRYFAPVILRTFLTRLDTLLFFFLLWLQLGFTHGTDVVFPLIAKALRQSQYVGANSSRAEQLNIFLRMLVAIGFIHPDRASVIASTITESGLALIGIVFFITPRVATFVGTVLIGLIVPVYFSMSASTPVSLPITRHAWLSYWAVYGLVDAVYSSIADILNWLPLWYHAKLALILWLQLPYYRGASSLLDKAMGQIGSLVSIYRRRTITPRKRKHA